VIAFSMRATLGDLGRCAKERRLRSSGLPGRMPLGDRKKRLARLLARRRVGIVPQHPHRRQRRHDPPAGLPHRPRAPMDWLKSVKRSITLAYR
jgi:hypothetical protein